MSRVLTPLMLAFGLSIAGCDAPQAQFRLDRVHAFKTLGQPESAAEAKAIESQLQNLKDVMTGLFGTPDEAHVPQLADVDVSEVLDANLVAMAAGPVGSDESGTPHGLYREHCAHCHGISGDGAGPTAAFLNPYPRDFRLGKFKFKSTPLGVKPTHDDLRRTLMNGIPETAMPSFRLLADDEIDALVNYVKYLAIRGEVERRLTESLLDLDEGAMMLDVTMQDGKEQAFQDQLTNVKETVGLVVGHWANAASQVSETPAPPEDWLSPESVRHGRELFFSVSGGNCVKCHGQLALGDGETGDFDDWTKDIDSNLTTLRETAAQFVNLGFAEPRLLNPRPIRPRNLRNGVYRGGRRPVDLYLRVKNGIEGTPMPQAGVNLTPDDVWKIIAYVRSLPHEPLSVPAGYEIEFERERL